MTIVANKLFCMYTFCVVIVWIIVIATATRNLVTPQETVESEKTNTRMCKGLCEQCNCLGFYCGEECICECNNEQSDTECIARMQTNARKLKMPFEILIQGPTANSFVRNALQFEQNFERISGKTCHHKRSTVTIYKPNKELKSINNIQGTAAKDISGEKKKTAERAKRSTNSQFEWFQDFSNTLVRPAPLGRRPPKSEESKTTTHNPQKLTTKQILDNSWFSQSKLNVLTPKPLFNRRQSSDYDRNDNTEGTSMTSLRRMFPRQDAMRAFGKDIADALGVSTSKDSNENNGDSDNKSFITNIFKKTKLTPFMDTNDDLDNQFQMSNEESQEEEPQRMEPKKPANGMRRKIFNDEAVPDFRLPWFNPVHFLKKVQHAINQ